MCYSCEMHCHTAEGHEVGQTDPGGKCQVKRYKQKCYNSVIIAIECY